MGFGLGDVLSEEAHYSEFVCSVCQDLAEDAHCTECGHVFCAFCVNEWRERFSNRSNAGTAVLYRCPSCNHVLRSDIESLAKANPLAQRIMGRVRVRCPLHAQSCNWQGDYSDVQSHLTNSGEHLGTLDKQANGEQQPKGAVRADTRANADALKGQADAKYAAKAYSLAAALYDKAIALAPGVATYYSNRSACSLMRGDYASCIRDCSFVLNNGGLVERTDAMIAKNATRRAKARVELSQFGEAIRELEALLADIEEAALRLVVEEEKQRLAALNSELQRGQTSLAAGAFGSAASSFGSVLKTTSAASVVLQAAAAELGLGRIERCLRLTLQVLRRVDAALTFRGGACLVRGTALFLQDHGQVEVGLGMLREAVRLDPDDESAKSTLRSAKRLKTSREAAKALMNRREFTQAIAKYTELIDDTEDDSVDQARSSLVMPRLSLLVPKAPLRAGCFAERANCCLRAGLYEECLKDCAKALYVKDDCVDAWLTKAQALRKLDRHDEAVTELGSVMERWGSAELRVRHAHEQAVFDARRLKRPDYYAILGCRKVSTEREIKNAYRARSLEHHPDRHTQTPEDEKKEHEAKFKELGDALEILGDQQRRNLYDEGYDKQAIEERMNAAQRAAQNPHGNHHHQNHQH